LPTSVLRFSLDSIYRHYYKQVVRDVGSGRAMTSWEIRMKLLEPFRFRSGELGGAMRKSEAKKPGSRRAGAEEPMRNEDPT